jgi:uncharacterized protein (UPF0248 family)
MPAQHEKAAKAFKKVPGSSPSQIRAQFMSQVMGGGSSSKESTSTGTKLRPVKDVLNRLRFDEKYNIDDYVIGYIDRKAGILEKPVTEWNKVNDWESNDCIAYFKDTTNEEIVWDRARKVDLLFA